MEALRAAVTGVSISGEHDSAHCLLDKACQMYESNTLKHLDLASCVSRTLEIQGTTKKRELTFERGSLVLKNPEDKLSSATDSEIKVHYAMIRRRLAFQFARLMSHEQHCQWETFLFEALHRETPPGYNKPTLAALLQRGKAAFGRLTSTVQSIRQDAGGAYPLGMALLNLRYDPNITLFLATLCLHPQFVQILMKVVVRAKARAKEKGKDPVLQYHKNFEANGSNCPVGSQYALASIANQVAAARPKLVTSLQKVGVSAQNRSAKRTIV